MLILETIETNTIPEVLACDGGPGVDFVPRKSGTTPNGPVFGTPEEALQHLLGTAPSVETRPCANSTV